MEAEPKTASIENGWPLLYIADPRENETGGHYAANALCLEDGRVVTVSHWPQGKDVELKLLDPGNGAQAMTCCREMLPRVDTWVLALKATGSRFKVAMPIVGEQVDVSWFKISRDNKPGFHRVKGRVSEAVKIRLQWSSVNGGEATPSYKYVDASEGGLNIHVRPTIILDEPIPDVVCGAAVRNCRGELVGMVNASKRDENRIIHTLIMTPAADVISEPMREYHVPKLPPLPPCDLTPTPENTCSQVILALRKGDNSDGSYNVETANACIIEGHAVTVGHLLELAAGRPLKVIDPRAPGKKTHTRGKGVLSEYDAGVLDLEYDGQCFRAAPPVVGVPVTVSFYRWDSATGRSVLTAYTGSISGKSAGGLRRRDGSPFNRAAPEGGNQINYHERYAVRLQAPGMMRCGAAVVNVEGAIVGVVNAVQDPQDAPVTVYMSAAVDILEAILRGECR